jgi:hypothetical protein
MRGAIPLASLTAAGCGYALAFFVFLGPLTALPGAAGGLVGGGAAAALCRRTLRHGGTRGGMTLLFLLAALIEGGLAFVPALGYVEALLVSLLALRLLRGGGGRHAGLRILARD